jgi:hypothetical protein
MSRARELRDRLEVLPEEVRGSRTGSDPGSTVEKTRLAEEVRASRAELETLQQQLALQKKGLWGLLVLLRREEAVLASELNRTRDPATPPPRDLPLAVVVGPLALGLGFFLGVNLAPLEHPATYAGVAALALGMAGWWGHLRGRFERAVERAERSL